MTLSDLRDSNEKRKVLASLNQDGRPEEVTTPLDAGKPFDEHGVAELVRLVVAGFCLRRHRLQCIVLLKRTKEFEMARAGFMHARHNGVHNQ